MRHAEKNVTSTCAFGDRVAKCVLDKYRELIPTIMNRQTCLSGIVAFDSCSKEMTCLTLGKNEIFIYI